MEAQLTVVFQFVSLKTPESHVKDKSTILRGKSRKKSTFHWHIASSKSQGWVVTQLFWEIQQLAFPLRPNHTYTHVYFWCMSYLTLALIVILSPELALLHMHLPNRFHWEIKCPSQLTIGAAAPNEA